MDKITVVLLLVAVFATTLLTEASPRSKRSGYYPYYGYRYGYYAEYYSKYYEFYECKAKCHKETPSSCATDATACMFEALTCDRKCLDSEMTLTLEQFTCQRKCGGCYYYFSNDCMLKKRNCERKCVEKDELTLDQYKKVKKECDPKHYECLRSLYSDSKKSRFTCQDELLKCVDDNAKAE